MEYTMVNPNTGNAEDISCSVADMVVLKQEGWVVVFTPNPNSIISGRDTSGQGGGHGTSDGWKDVLREIKKKNHGSTIDV
jgi:hypothetical protein|tara:strand:+ start:5194 stop:5433 length:240 start_codon:yes stop_codon:yes gene_type:complete